MTLLDLIQRIPGVAPTLRDWLGDGGVPVSSALAEKRSMACVMGNNGSACPLNVQPSWWERAKNKIALAMREQLAVKHQLGLFVSKESELNVCRVCGCCLRLKVWTPISYVKEHLTDIEVQTLPQWCWMKKEIAALPSHSP